MLYLRKCCVVKDNDLTYSANVLNGSSGTDFVTFCQRICAATIQDSIEKIQKLEQLKKISQDKAYLIYVS